MKLSIAFRIAEHCYRSIAFVGAGGKSTAMFQLAQELAPAIVTTSTHLGTWQAAAADRQIFWCGTEPLPDFGPVLMGGITLVTRGVEEQNPDRLQGLSAMQLHQLNDFACSHNIPLLVEADGSRQLPVKAPAAHEPNIPPFVNLVVVVSGLSAVGNPLSSAYVHRIESFSTLGKIIPGDPITPEVLSAVLSHPDGGLKNIPPGSRRLILLNQADSALQQSVGQRMARWLIPSYNAVGISSLESKPVTASSEKVSPIVVHAVHEPVGGILLAAGGSSRMGKSKPLLAYEGEAFVHRVARVALEAGLAPVVVVLGAESDLVADAVSDLRVRIAKNTSWHSGQASSVSVGTRSLDEDTGAAIFMLADQPQVPLTLLHALVAEHACSMAPIIAPLVTGQRGNPVLFDRGTFPDLLNLPGDIGGRALFSRYPVTWIPWQDSRLLADIDTEEDYQKLVNSERI